MAIEGVAGIAITNSPGKSLLRLAVRNIGNLIPVSRSLFKHIRLPFLHAGLWFSKLRMVDLVPTASLGI